MRLVQGGDGARWLWAAGAWRGPDCLDEDEGPSPLRAGRCWEPVVSLVNRGTWMGGWAGWANPPTSLLLVLSPDSILAPASPQPRLLAHKRPAWIPELVSGNRPQGGLSACARLLGDQCRCPLGSCWDAHSPEGSPMAAVPPLALAWAAGRFP